MTRVEDTVEALIDEELARVSDVEPVAGIEERLLARLTSDAPGRLSGLAGRRWSWATAAAVVLAAGTIFWITTPSDSRVAQPARPDAPVQATRADSGMPAPASPAPVDVRAPEPERTAVRAGTPAARAHLRVPARAPDVARLGVFPSPVPVSDLERAFTALVAQTDEPVLTPAPPEELAPLEPIVPLAFAELTIEPLETLDPR